MHEFKLLLLYCFDAQDPEVKLVGSTKSFATIQQMAVY
jgi:hypothetical protein